MGQASFHTALRIGPSTMDRSKVLVFCVLKSPDQMECGLWPPTSNGSIGTVLVADPGRSLIRSFPARTPQIVRAAVGSALMATQPLGLIFPGGPDLGNALTGEATLWLCPGRSTILGGMGDKMQGSAGLRESVTKRSPAAGGQLGRWSFDAGGSTRVRGV